MVKDYLTFTTNVHHKELTMKKLFQRKSEEGATIIEYVLIAALLSIAAILALTNLGKQISTKFEAVSASVQGA